MPLPPLFAVHIGPEVLLTPWRVGGFVLMAAAVLPALWKVGEREIPRIGVLAAAFFVASSIHMPIPGTSVHLLLNGLTGVILRWRAPLAVAVGLTLQALLLSHGGVDALGVNFAVQVIPAVLAGLTFRPLFRVMPAFAAGLIVGAGTAAVTVLLNAVALYYGSVDASGWLAGTSLLLHLPVIAVEGVGVGFVCRVLAKGKPEWLGVSPLTPDPAPAGGKGDTTQAGNTSSNGTSH